MLPTIFRQQSLAKHFQDFERQVDEIFNAGRNTFGSIRAFPPTNVRELSDKYVMECAVPGYKKDQIKLTIEDHNDRKLLCIRGETSKNQGARTDDYDLREIHYSSFTRVYVFPDDADTERIGDVTYEDGILKLEVPKFKSQTVSKKELSIK